MIHLDTHVAVWLYAGDLGRFPKKALRQLEREELVISPIVLLEMQYLYELRRLTDPPSLVLKELEDSLGLAVDDEAFQRVVLSALGQKWTRDPFDRIIVAQAQVGAAQLMTKDATIRDNYRLAVWD